MDGAGFVEGEIDARMMAQQEQHSFEAVFLFDLGYWVLCREGHSTGFSAGSQLLVGLQGVSQRRMPGDPGQFLRDHLGGHHDVHTTGGDRAAGHGIVFRRIVLSEGNPAFGLDSLQTQGAVRGGTGEDDTDGTFAKVLGHGFKKMIDGAVGPVLQLTALQFKYALLEDHTRVGGYDVDVVGLDAQIMGNFADRH